jgi:hypothetical protein
MVEAYKRYCDKEVVSSPSVALLGSNWTAGLAGESEGKGRGSASCREAAPGKRRRPQRASQTLTTHTTNRTGTHSARPTRDQAAVVSGEGLKMMWDIKYLYDGECSMCRTLKVGGRAGCLVGWSVGRLVGWSDPAVESGAASSSRERAAQPEPKPGTTNRHQPTPTPQAVLERNDRAKAVRFVDISDMDYDPMANMGVVRFGFGGRAGGRHAAVPDPALVASGLVESPPPSIRRASSSTPPTQPTTI